MDGDSCSRKVRSYLCSYDKKAFFSIVFVANKAMNLQNDVAFVECGKEKDAADNYIYEHASDNDIVITRDLLFASRLVNKNIRVINDRGDTFDSFNIVDRLNERELNFNLKHIRLIGSGKRMYSMENFEKFKKKFNFLLERALYCS